MSFKATVVTPSKRRHDALSNSLPCHSRKKQKHESPKFVKTEALDVQALMSMTGPINTLLYALPSETEQSAPDLPTVPITLSPLVQSLDERAHNIHLKRQKEWIEDKGTEVAYNRHLRNYEQWWEIDQLKRQEGAITQGYPPEPVINAHPITAMKVSIFMNYELSRPKKQSNGTYVEGTTVGPSAIKQAITALEHYRHNHQRDPVYKSCPEAQIPLRHCSDINLIERIAEANEPQRQADSQETKTFGAISQTFSDGNELEKVSMSYFYTVPDKPSIRDAHLALRDRAMLLFSTAMAFRGDDTRSILLSDLGIQDIPMLDIGLDTTLKALVVFSNQGKTNTNGRIDIVAALGHRRIELCSIFALASYFFTLFHVLRKPPPNFKPDFDYPKSGETGYRDWYKLYLFPGQTPYTEMSADNHRKHFNQVKLANDICFKKVNHAGRPYAATTAIAFGASTESVKSMGLWSTPGSFMCYNRALPTDAMVALAGFNGRQLDSYFIPWECLDPPSDLLTAIFPWIEQEEKDLRERKERYGRNTQDASLMQFLRLLCFLCTVLLQDAALLYTKYPDLHIFSFTPKLTL